jgi:hypothetical protein
MARTFLQKFDSLGLDETVPPELIDGLQLYENHLKSHLDRTLSVVWI